MDKKNANNLLKKISEKTNQKWDMDKIKSLGKGFSKNDIQNADKMQELIKKVGKSLGMNLSSDKISKIQEKVQKKFKR